MKTNCPHCGASVEAESNLAGVEVKCPGCGKSSLNPAPGPIAAAYDPPPSKRTSALAVVSLGLSLSTLIGLGPLGIISGIICGHLAKAEIRRHPTMEGDGFATAGLAVGYTFLGLGLLAMLLGLAILGALLASSKYW